MVLLLDLVLDWFELGNQQKAEFMQEVKYAIKVKGGEHSETYTKFKSMWLPTSLAIIGLNLTPKTTNVHDEQNIQCKSFI